MSTLVENQRSLKRVVRLIYLVLLGLDELMVERAVAAVEVLQHLPEAPVLLDGLPELLLRRRHVHLHLGAEHTLFFMSICS
jgi:hypothetical protein